MFDIHPFRIQVWIC